MPTTYPGKLIKKGDSDTASVKLIQAKLKSFGYGCPQNGVFDDLTDYAVRMFQAQHFDAHGKPLAADGKIGPFTWERLFNDVPTPTFDGVVAPLLTQALGIAVSQIGIREQPEGSNRGPMVDVYLNSVGIAPNQGTAAQRFWCAAFMYWCFQKAASGLSRDNPLPKTAGCLDHWARAATVAGAVRIKKADALANPALIKPGMIFIQNHGDGAGHTGMVQQMQAGRMFTVEGNIAEGAVPGRNGVGVFATDRRKLTDGELVGFIDYSAA